ncbi:phage major capsid protein [Paraburkholderia guartelaensis]|uniref:Phage major capsid protein n=1 Tax=Paraburkholderia guartelaensis TaxID=2546446 RepID=A0ABU9SJJ6_9BURK
MYDNDVCLPRAARALALCNGDPQSALGFIRKRFGGSQMAESIIERGLVDTDTLTPDSDLLGAYGGRIADLIRRRSALGRIEQVFPFVHGQPFVPWMALVEGTSAQWIAENAFKPVGDTPRFVAPRLTLKKVAAIVVMSEEALRLGHANVDISIERACTQALADAVELALFSANPGDAATPPGLLTRVSAGSGNPEDDFDSLLASIPSAMFERGVVFAINPADTARWMRTGLADPASLTARDGGYIGGVATVTTPTVPPGNLAWLCPGAVLMVNGGALISRSTAAALTFDSGDGSGVREHSLWVENLRGIRSEVWINWAPLEEDAGGAMTGVFAPARARTLTPTPPPDIQDGTHPKDLTRGRARGRKP